MNISNPTLLISFCNSGLDSLDRSLGTYDLSLMKFSFLKVQANIEKPDSLDMGFTGMCIDDFSNIYIAVQSPVPRILVLDKAGLYIKTIHLPGTIDLHDIKCYGDKLWIASTGNNRLYMINLNKDSSICEVQAFHESNCDVLHFNSFLHCYDGNSLYSFTRDEFGENIGTVRNSRNEIVLNNLKFPHSLVELRNHYVILNSKSSEVIIFNKFNYDIVKVLRLSGFLRGACSIDDKLYVGRSSLRLDSRKAPSGQIEEVALEDCRCGFYEISISDFSVICFTDLTVYGSEIYEIIASHDIDSINLQNDSFIYSIARQRKRVKQLENSLDLARLLRSCVLFLLENDALARKVLAYGPFTDSGLQAFSEALLKSEDPRVLVANFFIGQVE